MSGVPRARHRLRTFELGGMCIGVASIRVLDPGAGPNLARHNEQHGVCDFESAVPEDVAHAENSTSHPANSSQFAGWFAQLTQRIVVRGESALSQANGGGFAMD